MIAAVLLALRASLSGPYGIAAIAVTTVVGMASVGTAYLKLHTHFLTKKVEARATAICEERERADRLERENRALVAAHNEAQLSLAFRDAALTRSSARVSTLEAELQEARDALARSEDAARVVFAADDPWLRKRAAKAAPATGGGHGSDPVQPHRSPRAKRTPVPGGAPKGTAHENGSPKVD